tara:strand:+ start:231 stop:353 length:123 start_codon:yes stop_codon:yes gene_type:complete
MNLPLYASADLHIPTVKKIVQINNMILLKKLNPLKLNKEF